MEGSGQTELPVGLWGLSLGEGVWFCWQQTGFESLKHVPAAEQVLHSVLGFQLAWEHWERCCTSMKALLFQEQFVTTFAWCLSPYPKWSLSWILGGEAEQTEPGPAPP